MSVSLIVLFEFCIAMKEPLRLLVIDKTSVLESVRERWDRLGAVPGVEMTLLAPEVWVENYTPLQFPSDEARTYHSVIGRALWPGKEARSFYAHGMFRAFKSVRPHVVLMMEESFAMFALQTLLAQRLYAPSAKLVFYSNNITTYNHFTYRLGKLYKQVGRYVTPRFDVGLCVNDIAARVLQETGHDVAVKTLFYGVNERLFFPRNREESRAALGLPADDRIILYAGRLMELKGVQDLMIAFDRIRNERTNTPEGERLKLLIVGAGEYSAELHTLASRLDSAQAIEFRDLVPIEQMPALMSAADLFVLPSRAEINEQFGRVNVEAMLCGTTIIGSTSGGIPEAIGDGGFVFEAGNIDALADTIRRALDKPEESERRRQIGYERALSLYSADAFIKGIIALCEELTGKSLQPTE